MTPFFFGRTEVQLFGAYDAPAGGGRNAVVLCYPFGREYLLAHGTFRLLARKLAAAGLHVLRFDYSGTGDSAGEIEDAREARWVADVSTAIDEVKELAQAEQVTLVGMRYGAALAARAVRGRADVNRLVLWDAVTDGAGYLARAGVSPDSGAGGAACEASGVVLTPALRADIEGLTLERYGAGLPATLVLTTSGPASRGIQLRERLGSVAVDCRAEHVPDVAVWQVEWGQGGEGMAVSAVQRIVEWLS